jgi:hypothetical protein
VTTELPVPTEEARLAYSAHLQHCFACKHGNCTEGEALKAKFHELREAR